MPHWLALAAMLIQFIASYGHLHPEDFDFLIHSHGTPAVSADHGSTRPVGDPMALDIDCPICMAMQLLGSSALPDGIHLVPALAHGLAQAASIVRLWLIATPYLLFETRGPPRL